MKLLKALAAFFGVVLPWSLDSEVIAVNNQRNMDSNPHQAVNVNQQYQIANIHNYHEWNGWDAIWDYRKSEKNILFAYDDARFSIGKTHVKSLAQFGPAIEQLCRGIPTYYAYQEQGANLPALSPGCANVGILNLFGIYLCGNIPNC